MQLMIDMSSDTYTRVCAGGELVGHHLRELYNSVRNGKIVEQNKSDGRERLAIKEVRKEIFIAKRVIGAIDNFDELKVVYDEEKSVIREALVRFVHRMDAMNCEEGESE